MDENIIIRIFIEIGLIIILIIIQIITYKYAKANSPEIKVEEMDNSLSIKIYQKNKLVFFSNQYLIPIIIIIFSLCVLNILCLLIDYKFNIFEKLLTIIMFLYIAFFIYTKNSIRKKTIIFGIVIFSIIIIAIIRILNKI